MTSILDGIAINGNASMHGMRSLLSPNDKKIYNSKIT